MRDLSGKIGAWSLQQRGRCHDTPSGLRRDACPLVVACLWALADVWIAHELGRERRGGIGNDGLRRSGRRSGSCGCVGDGGCRKSRRSGDLERSGDHWGSGDHRRGRHLRHSGHVWRSGRRRQVGRSRHVERRRYEWHGGFRGAEQHPRPGATARSWASTMGPAPWPLPTLSLGASPRSISSTTPGPTTGRGAPRAISPTAASRSSIGSRPASTSTTSSAAASMRRSRHGRRAPRPWGRSSFWISPPR